MKFLRRLGDTVLKKPYVSLAVLCFLVALVFNQTKQNYTAAFMVSGLAALLALAIGLYLKGQLTRKRLIILLIAAGVLLRIGYALYTPYDVRQHDVGGFGSEGGHAGYIEYVANHLALPDTNGPWQYYHPPLHHIIAGLWLKLNLALGIPSGAAYENVQLLTVFYSSAALLVCCGIIKEFKLSPRAGTSATGILCFHPAFILLAGSINNDMLMILLFLAAMLFTVRWHNNPSMKNVLFIAVFLGAAMMTKLSAFMLAPAIAFVFLVKLWQRRIPTKKAFAQMGTLCVVSAPLGLWYPLRNLLLFQQPLTYVPRVGETAQYVGNSAFADRLWNIPWSQLASPYQNWDTGYNIPLSIVKTSAFGETDLRIGAPADILLYLNILLSVAALCAMIRILAKGDKERSVLNWFLGIAWAALMAGYIKFCFDFPNICTQDFRYIVPTLLIGTVFIGQALDRLISGSGIKKNCARAIEYAAVLFCVFSSVVYVVLGMI